MKTSKEIENYTLEHIGFQAIRELNAGAYEKMSIDEARAEMQKFLNLTPQERTSQTKKESEYAREMGVGIKRGMNLMKDFPPDSSGEITYDQFGEIVKYRAPKNSPK